MPKKKKIQFIKGDIKVKKKMFSGLFSHLDLNLSGV